MTNRRLRHPVPRTIEFAGSDGTRLAGTLTPPPGTAQFPAVLAVHAAGGGTRDAPPHRHLASFLPSLGVATFSYDRRGEGSSDGRPGAPLAVLAGDARAAFSALARQPGCAAAVSGCGVTARAAGSRRWPRQAHLTYLPARTWQPMKACWKMRPHSSGISISAPRFLSYGSRCSRSMARPTAGFPELGRDPGEPLNSGQRHGAALSRRHGGRIRPRVPADLDWSQAEGPGTRVGGGSQDLGGSARSAH